MALPSLDKFCGLAEHTSLKAPTFGDRLSDLQWT